MRKYKLKPGTIPRPSQDPELKQTFGKAELPNAINHPLHYNQGIECIDYIESHHMNFNQGNAIKYLTRYKHKNGLEDLKKAKWYVERLIKGETKNNEQKN